MTGAVEVLDPAVVATLDGDAPFVAFLGGQHTYAGEVPAKLDRYIQLDSSTAGIFGRFMQPGERASLMIHGWERLVWSDGSRHTGKDGLRAMWGHLKRLLHETPLALSDGVTLVHGTITLLGMFRDPAGEHMHLVSRYDLLAGDG